MMKHGLPTKWVFSEKGEFIEIISEPAIKIEKSLDDEKEILEKAQYFYENDLEESRPLKSNEDYYYKAEFEWKAQKVKEKTGLTLVYEAVWRLYNCQILCGACGRIVYYTPHQEGVIDKLYHSVFLHSPRGRIKDSMISRA